jgi:hypothetical protein
MSYRLRAEGPSLVACGTPMRMVIVVVVVTIVTIESPSTPTKRLRLVK